MTFQTIGVAAKDPNFQSRVRGSLISMAAAIIAAPLESTAILNNSGAKLTTQDCKNLALNFCKGTHLFTDQAAASLMLLNSNVAAAPNNTDQPAEDALQYQTKEMWLVLVAIG